MLDVFWYRPREGFNLGDEITSFLLENLFEREHQLSSFPNAELLSTGSTLSIAWDRPEHGKRVRPLNVVGSGCMYPTSLDIPDYMKVWSVRGHLTRLAINGTSAASIDLTTTVGDPGLLLSRANIDLQYTKTTRIGYIPHFQKIDTDETRLILETLDAELIDFRTNNFSNTVSRMASCDIIVSQALHGIIIADSFRIPNAWYWGGALHRGSEYKFYDYFSAIGRDPNRRLVGVSALNARSISDNIHAMDPSVLSKAQAGVMHAFEAYLSTV